MKNFRMPLRFYSWCSTRGAHGNLALKANIVTVMLFIIITFVCSLKKPVFSICSFQCALVANSYLGDFYYLNLALCGIVIVSFIYYAKGFRFLDKRDVPLIMAFTVKPLTFRMEKSANYPYHLLRMIYSFYIYAGTASFGGSHPNAFNFFKYAWIFRSALN